MTAPTPGPATERRTDADADGATAEYIAFAEFRNGLPRGRFHVVVNPALAQRFVAQRTHATAVALALIGPGIASALAGHPVIGAVLVALAIVLRRVVRWQAPKILLYLASHDAATYEAATTQGVMEVQRV